MKRLSELAADINANAVAHGFWDEERNFGEMVALMHSELSEALEEHRAGKPAEYVVHAIGCPYFDLEEELSLIAFGCKCKTEGTAVELVDCLIRILDTLHSFGVDIDGVVARKMAYNASRPYKHGKAY